MLTRTLEIAKKIEPRHFERSGFNLFTFLADLESELENIDAIRHNGLAEALAKAAWLELKEADGNHATRYKTRMLLV